ASNTAMVDSCKFALLSCDYRTIITNYLIAAKFELYDVMDRLLDQIRANFICISRTKEFLSLPADVVM
ncbi:kelch-like 31, partial [Biomphalaria glabrata]